MKSAYPNGHEFRFPQDLPCPPLGRFLASSSPPGGANEESNHVQKNLESAFKQIRDVSLGSVKKFVAIDIDASSQHMTWNSIAIPCLTRSRYRGHWISNGKRRTTIDEMFRLQGNKLAPFSQTCSDIEMGRLIGNAMLFKVVEEFLTLYLLMWTSYTLIIRINGNA